MNIMKKRGPLFKMRGGNTFPSSFSNAAVSASPQSYLPYNDFSNDPNYSVISSRNTGPFLTGTVTGGSSRRKSRKMRGGSNISSVMNYATNGIGIMPSPSLNESSGVAGIMGTFSGNASAYNPTPSMIAPLA